MTTMLQLHPSLDHYVFGPIFKDGYYNTTATLSPGLESLYWIFWQNAQIFKIPSWVSCKFDLFMLSLYVWFIYYLLDFLLKHYICVLPFHIFVFACFFFVPWTVIILAALKSILNQSRCSLEPKNFLRVLCPLKPLLHWGLRTPSPTETRYAHFCAN